MRDWHRDADVRRRVLASHTGGPDQRGAGSVRRGVWRGVRSDIRREDGNDGDVTGRDASAGSDGEPLVGDRCGRHAREVRQQQRPEDRDIRSNRKWPTR